MDSMLVEGCRDTVLTASYQAIKPGNLFFLVGQCSTAAASTRAILMEAGRLHQVSFNQSSRMGRSWRGKTAL